ncbi:MAG TPA: type 2 lanthipeptide synthetase LanM [Candidatus Polarisedimenticolia bacterium]|jgi:type 2 lantibiotic biosynthesis protein LanM|nr:type 2 lanthipeptide synthetase LanM [Candidatus Polarisedimenticolia bacterium]
MGETRFLETADAIGARLCRDALWSGGRCNWLGDAMEFAESRWQVIHRSFGGDLYGGTSGIALFLARLYSATQEKVFKKTAEGAVQCALSQIKQWDPAQSFGFYSGLTGIAYALAETALLLDHSDWEQQSLQILEKLPQNVAIQSWDIISGSAGIIPVLLRLHQRFFQDSLLDLAVRHGDMLLQSANRNHESWSWKTIAGVEQKDLTGFSHGTAGIAWSLLELHAKFNEPRFLEGAIAALRYERRWFDVAQENWPDFRSEGQLGTPVCGMAWCHGAPGIGLSRVRAQQLLNDDECRNEADIAIRTTARGLSSALHSGQGNCSLCHGSMGNAELLLFAGDVQGNSSRLEMVVHLADEAIQAYRMNRNPWPCGVLNGGENPGLMLGLAGIGYFYLRLFDRSLAPSILLVGPN